MTDQNSLHGKRSNICMFFTPVDQAKVTKRGVSVTRAEMNILSQVVQHQTYIVACIKTSVACKRSPYLDLLLPSGLRSMRCTRTYRLADIMFCLVVNNRHAYIHLSLFVDRLSTFKRQLKSHPLAKSPTLLL